MKSMIFKLNKTTYLKFSSFLPIQSLGRFYRARIQLVCGSKNFSIHYRNVGDGLYEICEGLKKVLANKVHINIPNNEDIGYAYNKYLNLPKSILLNTKWVGANACLLFFATTKFYTSVHLYNDPDGNIILHVSKSGHWDMKLKKGESGYVSYKDFMKKYKPLYVGTISRSVAQKLLLTFERLLVRVRENQDRYDADCVAAIKEGTVCKWCVRDEKYRKELRASRTSKKKINKRS